MVTINFGLYILVAAASAAAGLSIRHSHSHSDVANTYLPPALRLALPTVDSGIDTTTSLPFSTITTIDSIADSPVATTEPQTSLRSAKGYEYRTVRRLKYRYRTQRDVSHLFANQPNSHYLPPKKDYLPPQEEEEGEVPNLDDTVVVDVPILKVANEYLPPANDNDEVIESIEIPVTKADYATTTTKSSLQDENNSITESPLEDTETVLAADGYHYKRPEEPLAIEPQVKSTASEYLPPLDEDEQQQPQDIVEVQGPAGGESAILSDDGYHYRVVKRLRI